MGQRRGPVYATSRTRKWDGTDRVDAGRLDWLGGHEYGTEVERGGL